MCKVFSLIMYLYNIKIQRSVAIKKIISGSFIKKKSNDIINAKINYIDLYTINEYGSIVFINSSLIFGLLRSIDKLILLKHDLHYINCGSNSGGILFLKYSKNLHWTIIFCHYFGRSGIRRIIPGFFLSNDIKGRVCMIAAIEQLRYIYLIRDFFNDSEIVSTPIELQKTNSILTELNSLENGLNNPYFATLEIDKTNDKQIAEIIMVKIFKYIIFYEFDLGLNLLITSYIDKLSMDANMIIPIREKISESPGCIITSPRFLICKIKNFNEQYIYIPKRTDLNLNYNSIITGHSVTKYKGNWYYFVQNEEGDIFIFYINIHQDSKYVIHLSYFDTIFPGTSFTILKKGYILLSSIHYCCFLYKFKDGKIDLTSFDIKSSNILLYSDFFFQPFFSHQKKNNFEIIKKIDTLSIVNKFNVCYNSDKNQLSKIHLLTGGGFSSFLTTLEYGIRTNEILSGQLPALAKNIWIIQKNGISESFLIISFEYSTVSFLIDKKISETNLLCIDNKKKTIYISLLDNDSILQVTELKIRHIKYNGKVTIWTSPNNVNIIKTTSSKNQIVIELANLSLIYFETDCQENLIQLKNIKIDQSSSIIKIIEEFDNNKSKILARIIKNSNLLHFINIEKENFFQVLKTCNLSFLDPYSLFAIKYQKELLHLFISFTNGVLLELQINCLNLNFYTTKQRFVGKRSPKLSYFFFLNYKSLLILSDPISIGYKWESNFKFKTLSYTNILENGIGFLSKKKKSSIITGYKKNKIFFIAIENLNSYFTLNKIPIYTKGIEIIFNIHINLTFVLQNEIYNLNFTKKNKINTEKLILNSNDRYKIKNISVLQLIGKNNKCSKFIYFDTNDLITCMKIFNFKYSKDKITFLILGSRLLKKNFGFLYLYKIDNLTKNIILFYKAFFNNIPLSLNYYNNIIIVGSIGKLYLKKIGKKKFLTVSSISIYNCILTRINIFGNRMLLGDYNEGLYLVKLNKKNSFIFVAKTIEGKFIESILFLDYDTFAVTDLLGNFIIFRLTKENSIKIENDPRIEKNNSMIVFNSLITLDVICTYFINECIKSVYKFKFLSWKDEILVYVTNLGTIGCFLPLKRKLKYLKCRKEINFLYNLSIHLIPINTGLKFLNFFSLKSTYYPIKRVLDSDLCEIFNILSSEIKIKISKSMGFKIETINKHIHLIKSSAMIC